eukprot:GHVO01003310.1.p1 GENE.GHVO01003310.1~~GHVO01003310.1.p1  ORF type:complete len:292 (+),score=31.73 GHVO01003310.1:42-878(+)
MKGLNWCTDEENLLQIPWRHGSSRSWKDDDVQLFSAWAKHSGKSSYLKNGNVKPNRLKANFRCAINSQVDIKEERSMRVARGPDACKVYRFLTQQPRRSEIKRRRTSSGDSDLENCQAARPLRSNCSFAKNDSCDLSRQSVDHEEEVVSEEHSYSSALSQESHATEDTRIPTIVAQMSKDECAQLTTTKDTEPDDCSDDSAFSEMSDLSDELVIDEDWIKSENLDEMIQDFDEGALLGTAQQPHVIDDDFDEFQSASGTVLTELFPVDGTRLSIAIMP